MKRIFLLKGLDCPNCSAKIEKEVGELDGVQSSVVNLMKQTLTINVAQTAADTIASQIETIVHSHEPDVEVSEIVQESQPLLKTKQESKQFIERVNHLPKQYAIIMQEYLRNALKNIGITLNSIMKLQDMTDQDIAKLLDCKANKIQALRTQKSTNESQDFINLLSRGLFVSESVIRTGYGQKFGNWNDMLKGDILKEAMKEKDELKKDTITMLRAAILQVEKDDKKVLTQSEMEAIVAKQIKSRKESLDDYKKANRNDIVSKIEKEIEILTEYLPEQLTLEEIKKLVSEAIEKTGAASPRDMGKVMQEIRPKIAGKADGKVVSDMVKQMLA